MATSSITPPSLSAQRLLDAWNSLEPANKAQCRKRAQKVLALLQTLKPFFHRADLEKMRDMRAKLVNEAKLAEEVDTCIATIDCYPIEGQAIIEGPERILPWQRIFSFLTARKDFFNVMLVCKQWAQFVKDPKMLARMLERGCFGKLQLSQLHKLLQQCESKVRIIDLPCPRTEEEQRGCFGKLHLSQLLKLIQQCGSEVRNLDLPGLLTEEEQNRLNNENLSALLHACPNLQSLSLCNTVYWLGGKVTTSVDELRKIFVETGIANTLSALFVAGFPGMDEKALKELTQFCPHLKPENVHYMNREDYNQFAYRELVKKGVPLARCLTLSEEEKKIYFDKSSAIHFLVGLGFDIDHVFKQPALLDIYTDSNRQGVLLSLITFGIRPSILRSLPANSLKYLYETIFSSFGDLREIANKLPSLDFASFKLVLDHSPAIKELVFWGMDFEEFCDLPYEQRLYVLQNHEDFARLIRTFASYNNFTLATLVQVPEEKRKIILHQLYCSSIDILLDPEGEPFETMLQLDPDTFKDISYHWCDVSQILKMHGSAKLAEVYQLPEEQRKATITNLHGLPMLLRDGMTVEALRDATPESIKYVLNHPLPVALLLKLGLPPKEIFNLPFIGKTYKWESWISGIGIQKEWHDCFTLISQRVYDYRTAENGWHSDFCSKLLPYLEPAHPSRQWILDNFMSVLFLLQRGCALASIVRLSAQELEVVCDRFYVFSGRMRIPLSQYDVDAGEQVKEMIPEVVSHIFGCHFVKAEALPSDREAYTGQNTSLTVADVIVLQQEGIPLDRFVELNSDMRQKVLANPHELKWHLHQGFTIDEFIARSEERT